MSHRNARLTPFLRREIVDLLAAGHKPGELAKQFHITRTTVHKWKRRFETEGDAGLQDRTSRPRTSPTRTSVQVMQQVIAARVAEHVGARELSVLTGVPASTIGVVLRRAGMPHLRDVDRVTGQLLRQTRRSEQRYEHDRPGSLVHVDVKKLGKIPPGGGHRAHGRSEEVRGRGLGWDYVHVAVDDHSRLAYAEVLPDERAGTCAGFLHRAAVWFREHGVVVRRVLTDNAKVYRASADWAAICVALQIKRRFIKPGCPWTNGKAERFNRTLQERWAYRQAWTDNEQRTQALDGFLIFYNTVRGHTSLNGSTPISRLTA
ncbi:MAG: family transposase [Frankiales bacterium]|nr:family transposase [Frankiales bacterium]